MFRSDCSTKLFFIFCLSSAGDIRQIEHVNMEKIKSIQIRSTRKTIKETQVKGDKDELNM